MSHDESAIALGSLRRWAYAVVGGDAGQLRLVELFAANAAEEAASLPAGERVGFLAEVELICKLVRLAMRDPKHWGPSAQREFGHCRHQKGALP